MRSTHVLCFRVPWGPVAPTSSNQRIHSEEGVYFEGITPFGVLWPPPSADAKEQRSTFRRGVSGGLGVVEGPGADSAAKRILGGGGERSVVGLLC